MHLRSAFLALVILTVAASGRGHAAIPIALGSPPTVWARHTAAPSLGVASAMTNTVYLTEGRNITARDIDTGAYKWQTELPCEPIHLNADVILVAVCNKSIAGLSSLTGDKLWAKDFDGDDATFAQPSSLNPGALPASLAVVGVDAAVVPFAVAPLYKTGPPPSAPLINAVKNR